jgi:hypothetical protein
MYSCCYGGSDGQSSPLDVNTRRDAVELKRPPRAHPDGVRRLRDAASAKSSASVDVPSPHAWRKVADAIDRLSQRTGTLER